MSHDEKKIDSSQHSQIKKNFANQLREKIDSLIKKRDTAKAEAWKALEEHDRYKAKGKDFDVEIDYYWRSYRTWSDEAHRLEDEIQVKLKAVQKYESPKKIEEPKVSKKEKQFMKYGPSDEEE